MSLNAGEVVYKIFGDTAEFKKSIGKLGSIASKSLAGIGAAVSAASVAVGKLSQEAINAYGEFEQLKGGVETLFGAGGMEIEEYARSVGSSVDEVKGKYESLMAAQSTVMSNAANAFRTAGMSANEYMQTVTNFSASLIESLGGDTEAAAKKADMAITDMADNINKIGSDAESVKNAYQGFAKGNFSMLDNLKLGYFGTKEEMERLLAKAEELSGFEYDISSFADIVDAIHVVQTEMGITGTTADEAARTIQGSISMMKAAWQNALTGMADPEQDFDKLMNDLIESVVTVSNNLIPRIEAVLPQLASGIEQLVGGILPRIPDTINDMLPDVLRGAEEILAAILDTLGSLAETGGPVISENAKSIITTLVKGISDNLPGLIGSAAEMVVTIAEAILDSDNVKTLSQAAVDILLSLVNSISENLDTLIPAAVNAVLTIADALINNVDKLLDAAEALIMGLADGLLDSLPELIKKVPALVIDICAAFAKSVPDVIEFAVEFCAGIADYILNYDWESLGSDVHKIINEALNNALHGDSDYTEKEAAAAKERISRYDSLTKQQIGKLMDNTSNKLKELEDVWAQLQNGTISYEDIPKWMRNIMDRTGESIESFFSTQIGNAKRNMSELTDAFSKAPEAISAPIPYTEASQKSWNSMSEAEREAARNAAAAAEEITDAIAKLSDDEAKALKDQAKIDLADGLISEDTYYSRLEEIKNALDKESKLYSSYAVEIANGRKKLREARAKQSEQELKSAVQDKFRDLETEQLEKGYDDSWLLAQERAFIETLDHNSEVYKEYNLKLLQEQQKIDKQAETEAERTAKNQMSALRRLYESVVNSRDSLAKSMAISASDIFESESKTDVRTGEKSNSDRVNFDAYEKKLRAKRELTSKIAELYEKNTPDSIVRDLVKMDPEKALSLAKDLLRNPTKLKKLSADMSSDDEYSKLIANMITEHSDEFAEMGDNAGTVFGEQFSAAALSTWEETLDKLLSDDAYTAKLIQNVRTANSSAAIASSSLPKNYTAEETTAQNTAANAPGMTSSGNVYKILDADWNYIAKAVKAAARQQEIRGGG